MTTMSNRRNDFRSVANSRKTHSIRCANCGTKIRSAVKLMPECLLERTRALCGDCYRIEHP